MLAAPLGQLPMGLDRVGRCAGQLGVLGFDLGGGIDASDLGARNREPPAGRQVDDVFRFVGGRIIDDPALDPPAVGQLQHVAARNAADQTITTNRCIAMQSMTARVGKRMRQTQMYCFTQRRRGTKGTEILIASLCAFAPLREIILRLIARRILIFYYTG